MGILLDEYPFKRVTMPSEGLAFFSEGKPWSKGWLWGVMKATGEVITVPRLTTYREFKEGFAVAAENDTDTWSFTYGYIGTDGEWRLKPQFLAANAFSEGVAYAKKGGEADLWNLFSASGDVLIDSISLGGSFVSEGLAEAYVPKIKRFGFRSIKGDWIIPATFTGAKPFSEGLASVLEGKPGEEFLKFIDREGAVKIKPSEYVSVEGGFSEGLACVYRPVGRGGQERAGYINKDGEEVIPCTWGLGTDFSEGLAAVQDHKTGLWGFINKTGEVVIKPAHCRASPFRNGVSRVRATKVHGPEDYINKEGNVIWKSGTKPKQC
jgi:hypothetical protein